MTEKRFNVFDVDGTIFLEDHKEGSYHIGEIGNVDVNCLNDIADRLNELNDKNKFLSDFRGFITMEHQKIKEENEQLKKELKAYKNFSDRKLAENKRIHKDWDKLWKLCKDKGFTEEELIKELER